MQNSLKPSDLLCVGLFSKHQAFFTQSMCQSEINSGRKSIGSRQTLKSNFRINHVFFFKHLRIIQDI
ncbi:CLUMA_CG012320, isoform A [Clunio marinus]|uniref:CLUMA_CG012320, isoform A n=1 Tax=Clunio marinus TaxID=568069 RepID=A0A1J1IGI0_9DIPT|nr:CLUMA_CG012320, isoform A [Clunio marinus]